MRPAWHTEATQSQRVECQEVSAVALAWLRHVPGRNPHCTWHDFSPLYPQLPPHPSHRGIVLSWSLAKTQEEGHQGYRVVLDTPCVAS